jgi:hypothetical protein
MSLDLKKGLQVSFPRSEVARIESFKELSSLM